MKLAIVEDNPVMLQKLSVALNGEPDFSVVGAYASAEEALRMIGETAAELASSLGTVPETLSRAFAKLAADGIMKVHGQMVTVLDMRALASLGSGYEEGA